MSRDDTTQGQHVVNQDRPTGVSFQQLDDGSGIEVIDPIERHRYTLQIQSAATPRAESTDELEFPVDEAVSFTVESLTLPTVVPTYVRDADHQLLAKAEHNANVDLPNGRYSIEISAPIKIYLRVTSPVKVSADLEQTSIKFKSPTQVVLGARSRHDHPAGTISTTDVPEDMMSAVSMLGSALKSTNPERSYPTLRGHPPLIERGDSLSIPNTLSTPETGVRIELPPEYRYIYPAAPLAYYLGAVLVPSDEPRLITGTGLVHPLDSGERAYEDEIERLLKQVFFLDCITRTEGIYKTDLHERTAVEDSLGWDPATIYEQSLAEQLDAYLSVPFEAIEPHIPTWKLKSRIDPTPCSIEALPFLVNDLAVVRTPDVQSTSHSESLQAVANDFLRDETFTRSMDKSPNSGDETLQVPEIEKLEAQFNEGMIDRASDASIKAYRNRLDRSPTDGDIDIAVVINDPQMAEEVDVVNEVYGSRSNLPFDVTVHKELTSNQLAVLLGADLDFLHYIGHVDEVGVQCADTKLNLQTVESIGVDAFFLNACQSYNQGMALIDEGAIGGVVTFNEIPNRSAVRLGGTMARLLNRGFPLRSGLEIARDETHLGNQYVVIGDGTFSIAQAESGTNVLCEVEEQVDCFEVTLKTYPTDQKGIGSEVVPFLGNNDQYYLNSSEQMVFSLSRDDLIDFLRLEDVPVLIDDELRWSSEIVANEL